MKYSKNAITQLKRQYKSVLLKCALINAALFMTAAPAMAGDPGIGSYDLETNTATINEAVELNSDLYINNVTLINNSDISSNESEWIDITNEWATIENNEGASIAIDNIYNHIATFNNNGSITLSDNFDNSFGTLNNNGQIQIEDLWNDDFGAIVNNNGRIDVEDELENEGTINNNGMVTSEYINNQGLFNNGSEQSVDESMMLLDAEDSESSENSEVSGASVVAEYIYNSGTFNNIGSIEITDMDYHMFERMVTEPEPESISVGGVFNRGTFLNGSKYGTTMTWPEPEVSEEESESTSTAWTPMIPESVTNAMTATENGSIIGNVINTRTIRESISLEPMTYDDSEDGYSPSMISGMIAMMTNPMMQMSPMMGGSLFYNNGTIDSAVDDEGNMTSAVYNDGLFYNGVEFDVTTTNTVIEPEETDSDAEPTFAWPQVESETTITYTANPNASITTGLLMNGTLFGRPTLYLYSSPMNMISTALSTGLVNGGTIVADTIINGSVLHNGEINLIPTMMKEMGLFDMSRMVLMSDESDEVSEEDESVNVPEPTFFEGAEISANTIYNGGYIINAGSINGDIVNYYNGSVFLANGTVDGDITYGNTPSDDLISKSYALYQMAHSDMDYIGVASDDEDDEALELSEEESDISPMGTVMAWSGENEVTGSINSEYLGVMEGASLKVGGDINAEDGLIVGYPTYSSMLAREEAMELTSDDTLVKNCGNESKCVTIPEESKASRLDIGTGTAQTGYAYFAPESTLALTVASEKDYGKMVAGEFEIEDGAKLEVTVLSGFSDNEEHTLQLLAVDENLMTAKSDDDITSPEDEYGDVAEGEDEDEDGSSENFNKFTDNFVGANGEDVIANNMFEIKRVDDEGNYSFKQIKKAEEIIDPEPSPAPHKSDLSGMAKAWIDDGLMTTPASLEMQKFLTDMAQNHSRKELADSLKALAPGDVSISHANSTKFMGRVFSGVGAHLSKPVSGLASGDAMDGVSFWGSTYYGSTKLDDRADNVYGFDADSKGITVGADKKITPRIKLGLGLQYDKSDVDAFRTDIDVETAAVFGYGEYRLNNWYVSGVAAYGRSDYDEKSSVGNSTVKAHYKADLFALQGLTGYDFITRYADVSPNAGLRYNFVKRHGYEDNANQRVSGCDGDILTGVAGVRFAKSFNGFRPSAYVNFTYDMISDRDNATVNLPNGASYSISGKRLNQFGTEAGAELEYNTGSWTLTANYEYSARKHFNSHLGMLTAKYSF